MAQNPAEAFRAAYWLVDTVSRLVAGNMGVKAGGKDWCDLANALPGQLRAAEQVIVPLLPDVEDLELPLIECGDLSERTGFMLALKLGRNVEGILNTGSLAPTAEKRLAVVLQLLGGMAIPKHVEWNRLRTRLELEADSLETKGRTEPPTAVPELRTGGIVGDELPRDRDELLRLRGLVDQWIAATRVTLGRWKELLEWLKQGDVALQTPCEKEPILGLETDYTRFAGVHDRNDLLVRYLPDDDRQCFLEGTQAASEVEPVIEGRYDLLMRPGVLDADVDAIIAGDAEYSESDREMLRETLAWRRANLECADSHRRVWDGLNVALKVMKRLEDCIVKRLEAATPATPTSKSGQQADSSEESSSGASKANSKEKAAPIKCPSDKAIRAYRLSVVKGGKQGQIATELRTNQGQVSRWIKDVKVWIKAGNVLPDLEVLKKPQSIDPTVIDMGARSDGRTPRQREKRSDDSDD